ncbi:hypothetical protein Hamer_G007432 [Homarus americanus]|uniref:Uncharacterized protein n=1 Tax=Homarus americanus TaxID=6706 RepID=A0A8J5JSS4_HOMAM|nr:hypothetical protein Hamer_G007432 [Homarus americanus]
METITHSKYIRQQLFAGKFPPPHVEDDDIIIVMKSEMQNLLFHQQCKYCGADVQLLTKACTFVTTLTAVCPECKMTWSMGPSAST